MKAKKILSALLVLLMVVGLIPMSAGAAGTATLQVYKLQAGSGKPLAGAVFSVKDPDGAMVFSGATDSTGMVEVTVTKTGNYAVTEENPPQYHIAPANPIQTIYIDVNNAEEPYKVSFVNEPFGSLLIAKRDENTGTPISGVNFQIKHVVSGSVKSGFTNTAGALLFENLEIGAWVITEITAVPGYVLDTTPYTVNVLPGSQGPTEIAITNAAQPGLRILKYDEATNTPIAGVTFEIWRNGALVDTRVTDSAGSIFIANAPLGTYTAFEKATLPGYELDPTPQTIELKAGSGVKQLIFFNSTKQGVELYKVDSQTLLPLQGAVFNVKAVAPGTFDQDFITDVNGKANLSALDQGAYIVTEKSAPINYLVDQDERTIQVTTGQPAQFVFTNTRKPDMTITKVNEQGDPLAGATFRIAPLSAPLEFIDRTTNAAGLIQTGYLAPGWYTVKELSAPTGYLLDDEEHIKLLSPGNTAELKVVNVRKSSLSVRKLDEATGGAVADAMFKIEQKLITGNGAALSYKLIKEGATNASGYITVDGLEPGIYVITETAPPPGYLPATVSVQEIIIAPGKDASVTFKNFKEPTLTIKKVDAATKDPLAGVQFNVKFYDDAAQGAVTDIGNFTTKTDGTVLVGPHLKAGRYKVTELAPPAGYEIEGSADKEIYLNGGDDKTITFENVKKGSIIVRKYDELTGELLKNTEFSISKQYGSVVWEGMTDDNGRIVVSNIDTGWYVVTEMAPPPGYVLSNNPSREVYVEAGKTIEVKFDNKLCPTLTIKKIDADTLEPLEGVIFSVEFFPANNPGGGWTQIGSYVTDAAGVIFIDENLQPGTYRVTETKAAVGYVLSGATVQEIALAGGDNKTLIFENVKKPSLIVWKYDEQTGETLPMTEFSISKMGGAVIHQGMTDADGKIQLFGLEPGWYTVDEMAPPPGYLMSDVNTKDVLLVAGETLEVKFDNLKRPTLTIEKQDSVTHDPLQYVQFKVEFSPNANLVGGVQTLGTYTTDVNGKIVLDTGLEPGWYRATEIEPPEGYMFKDPTVQEIFVGGGENKTLTFLNTPKAALIIRKIDSATGLPVAGATFEVRYLAGGSGSGGTLIKTAVTSVNGTITVTGLGAGTYIVEEVKAATGYELSNPALQTAYVSGAQQETIELLFDNPQKGQLVITKLDSATKLPIAGVTFLVTDGSGGVIGPNNGEFTTDATGVVEINEWLAVGMTVVVKEIRGPETHNMDAPAQTVKIAAATTHRLTFYNSPKSGLQILKVDADTNEPLAHAWFTVYKKNGELLGEYETDANGLVIIDGLEPGWLKILESRAPSGYLLDDTPKDVEITNNQFLKVTFGDKKIAGIQIKKIDSVTRQPIANVEFKVAKMDGALIGTYKTNSNGLIYVTLEPGWYTVTEVRADGYALDAAPRNVEVGTGSPVVIEVENTALAGMTITKRDAVTNKPLQGVVFDVLRSDGQRVTGIITEGNQLNSEAYSPNRAPDGTYVTDKDGRIVINNMPPAQYYVVERKALDGYELDETMHAVTVLAGRMATLPLTNTMKAGIRVIKTDSVTKQGIYNVEFTVMDINNIVVGVYYTDNNGVIDLIGVLPEGRYTLRETRAAAGYYRDDMPRTIELKSGMVTEVRWENTPERGQIQVYKKSGDANQNNGLAANSPLSGAIFEIYEYKSGVMVDRMVSGADGWAVSNPLPLGRYTVKEVQAPQWYKLSTQALDVTLEFATEIVKKDFVNFSANTGVYIRKTGPVECMPGDTIRYDIKNVQNTSTVQLTDFYWRDTLSTDAVRLSQIVTGSYNEALMYKIMYTTNKGDTKLLADNLSTTKNNVVNCSAGVLGLKSDEYIVSFTFMFGTVKAGFSCVEQPQVFVTVLETLTNGYEFANIADIGGKYGDEWIVNNTSWVTEVYKKMVPEPVPGPLPRTGY